ncbi:MAG: class I SAM-dependent methyltransferase [Patescibacteria group bacterium]
MIKLKDTGERLIPELHKQSLAFGEHLARYHAAKDLAKDRVVLDIASGAGYGSAFLAQTAKKVIGVDYDRTAVAYSKELYPLKNVEFRVGDAQLLPLEDSSVDVVVSLETIEHIPNPEKMVKEVVRVLKPNGIFYVSTPNDEEFIEGNEFHLHEFDFAELSKLINKYFKQAQYYYQGTWYASGVLNKKNFEGSSTPLSATKTFNQRTDKAIYFLSVATNGPVMPKLTENIVASDRFSELTAQKQHEERISSDALKIKRIDELVGESKTLKAEIYRLNKELGDILNSRSWKMIQKVDLVKRKIKRT